MALTKNQTDAIFVQNSKEDVISPSIAIIDATCIIADMMEENIAYVKKNGLTDTAKKSRERLLKLMEIGETFSRISTQNSALKTYNDQLLREIQQLRAYKTEVERQENLSKSL